MNDSSWQAASEIEKKLIDVMRNLSITKDEILRLIRSLPEGEKFVLKDTWLDLSRDESLGKWRRWESYKLLISRCITYPCDLKYFIKEVIVALGMDKSQIVDMTKAQVIPMERKVGDLILMVNLPIMTSVGPASVYLAVHRPTNKVERVGVHPDMIEAEIQ